MPHLVVGRAVAREEVERVAAKQEEVKRVGGMVSLGVAVAARARV
jgi:hypothetical protein